MKRIIDILQVVAAITAALPTAWAVFAGVTLVAVFPMPTWAAYSSGAAVVLVVVLSGLLHQDIRRYNEALKARGVKGLAKESGLQEIPEAWALWIAGGAIVAELALSLMLGLWPIARPAAVLVFPLLNLCGMFAVSVRYTLAERDAERAQLRETATHKPQTATQPAEPAPATAKSAPKSKRTPAKVRCTESGCGMEYAAVGGKGGHYKKHHAPIAIDKSLLIGDANG